jgi:uncharacterized iron-regulated membrane protein
VALAAPEHLLTSFLRRPQDVAFRKAVFQIHLWTGIGVGLYIFVIGLTGALLVFRSEMQHAAYPQFFEIADAAGPRADIGIVLQEFRNAYPDQPISGIDTPSATRQTFLTYVLNDGRYVAVFAHPVTAEVLGELPTDSFVSRLQDLHFELLGGETGRTLNGVGAICLILMAMTGLMIWWPGIASWRRAIRVDLSKSWKRLTFDLHSSVGIWMWALVLIWGISGVYFIFSREFRAIVNAVSPITSAPVVASNPALKGSREPLTVTAFVEKARHASPDSELVRILLPASDPSTSSGSPRSTSRDDRAPFIVTMTHPGLSRAEDDQGVSLYFDQFSGELLQTWDAVPRTAGDRFMAILAPLHIGLFGGMTVKILWAIFGLAPAVLFATGSLMWWNRVVSDRWSKLKARGTATPWKRSTAPFLTTLLAVGSVVQVLAQDAGTLQISHSGRGAYEASLTPSGDGFAASWYDTRDGNAEIYVRWLDGKGAPLGPERRLTNGTADAYEPDIQAVDSSIAVAWYEKTQAGALTAKLGLWNKEGVPRWTKSLSAAGHDGRNPVVRAVRGRLFCAWLEYSPRETPVVWGQWFDTEGRPAAPPLRLAPAGETTWNLNAAIDPQGRAWVVFDARAGARRDELFAVRVDGAAAELFRLSADDGFNSKYPDLAFAGNRAALTWFDTRDGNEEVYLFVGPVNELKEGLEQRAARVTHTAGESIGAYLAWNGRQVGLAWCDDTDGNQHDIYFQRFDDAGKAAGEPRRLTRNATLSLIPAVRPWRDGFALAWNEFVPDPRDVHGPDGRSEVMFAVVRGF